jgi:stage V sporulation protein R
MTISTAAGQNTGLLYDGLDWTFETIQHCYDAIKRIAVDELGLDTYPNRIEVITAEQMLDVYTSSGMPLIYKHWSFGKRFVSHESAYKRGLMGLAYEVVINSSPCISYLMEENTATMQALVIAHAAFGHNHFFKNNRIFQQWTEPSGIIDYLEFAQGYITRCEELHGHRAVERIVDAAHTLQGQAVHRHSGARPLDLKSERERDQQRRDHEARTFNDLWRTVPSLKASDRSDPTAARRRRLGLPEENILYFLEKTAPRLEPWEREIIRIVRLIAQYFYPQPQVKMMNEGCATWVHQHIMTRLHETGRINDAAFMEVIHSTTNVTTQPGFDHPSGSGFNPYALGFAMMTDIARICTDPTSEDRAWFGDFAGCQDPLRVLKSAWAEYRDESFIMQFLSPAVIRQFRMFKLRDDTAKPFLLVDAIHDDEGYRVIRRSLADSYDPSRYSPDIQIVDVDLSGDRCLHLEHKTRAGKVLHKKDAEATLRALADLWGYEVKLVETDAQSESLLARYAAHPSPDRRGH